MASFVRGGAVSGASDFENLPLWSNIRGMIEVCEDLSPEIRNQLIMLGDDALQH